MTDIRVELGERDCALRARGHATGSEAACAAVSGLLYALAGYLLNLEARGEARCLERRMAPGDVSLRCRGADRVRCAYEMAFVGLRQIAGACPACVRAELHTAFPGETPEIDRPTGGDIPANTPTRGAEKPAQDKEEP